MELESKVDSDIVHANFKFLLRGALTNSQTQSGDEGIRVFFVADERGRLLRTSDSLQNPDYFSGIIGEFYCPFKGILSYSIFPDISVPLSSEAGLALGATVGEYNKHYELKPSRENIANRENI